MAANEKSIQHEYVMKFFSHSEEKGGLGYRVAEVNIVSADLFIPTHLGEFIEKANTMVWSSLMHKFHQDEKALLRELTEEIKKRILDSSNVATFLNQNKTIKFKGEMVPLFLVSGTELRGDEDFDKNIFAVVEEMRHNIVCDGITLCTLRPDVSFFLNGIFIGYMELKSQINGQTAKNQGRGKIIGDYLECIKLMAERERTNLDGVERDRKDALRMFERGVHITASDIQETYVMRNIGKFYEDAHKDFFDEEATIKGLRPTLEKEFKLYPISNPLLSEKERFEEVMHNLYSKKMIEREILFYNFLKYSYKKERGKWVRSSNRGILIAPRPKQKYGCDAIVKRISEMLQKETEPDYYAKQLREMLLSMHVLPDKIDEILEQRDAYYNNKYVYSLLLQYAAGFGKSNIIGWTALMLKNLRFDDQWAYDKIMIVVDRLQLRGQLDEMMQNMNIDKAMFVEAYNKRTFVDALTKYTKRIVVVNIQKFLDLQSAIDSSKKTIKKMRVAFLIDEIHRSNTGENNREMIDIFERLQKSVATSGNDSTAGYKKKNLIIGLTATPSDKVLARFGEFKSDKKQIPLWLPFDSYTMKESIADGYTLDPTKHIIPMAKTMQFDLPEGVDPRDTELKITIEKAKIYANERRMRMMAEFIVNRLVSLVYGKIRGTGKAMLAVTSIPNAIAYCNMIRKIYPEKCSDSKYIRYKDAPISIVYSDNQENESCASMNGGKSEEVIVDEFKKAKNGLIIVVDKLQTGFDEHKLHTLFLDKEITGINAIQTICRVNRICKYKTDCHIVDLSWHNVNVQNIKDAYKQFCGTTVSQFNPEAEKRDLDIAYNDLLTSEISTRWFAKYKNSSKDVDYTLEMENGMRVWIIEQFKRAQEQEKERTEDDDTIITNEAKRLRKVIGHYGAVLMMLEDVYSIDKKYKEFIWLDFWQKYNRIYSSLMTGHGTDIIHPDVDTDDEVPGLTANEEDDEGPGIDGGSGGESTNPSLIDMINRWNTKEELTEEEIQHWKIEIDNMFNTFDSDENLLAILRDPMFSEESKDAEYQKIFKRYCRSLNRRNDLDKAMLFKNMVTENSEYLYDMFVQKVQN